MDLQAAIVVFLAILGLAMKPGPGMMAIMSRTLAQGMKACFVFMAGVCLVSMLFLALVMTGLKFAHDDLLFISILLKALAAVYLIYIGIKGLQHLHVNFALRERAPESLSETFTGAVMLTLANPLVILFYGGLLPSVVDIPLADWRDGIVIGLIICFVETGVAVLYCLPVAYSRHIFTDALLRRINLISSILMILVGLVIGYSAIPAQDLLSVL
ncbi:MAG: hypothetical protein DI551_10990 [Micavibrio aeruginosavorus]|uniref:LysE type translocator family protein n=1 Tax=Micavibrio aeruginosavorus TaxID=349221 RepID=A0A2W5MTB3_9BACT|nr:MAG: hypothetical protein DI551_10990 [Micavibrio aeruginosavorus]